MIILSKVGIAPWSWAICSCLDIAKQHATNTAFLVALTTAIYAAGKDGRLDAAEAMAAFYILVDVAIQKFTMRCRVTSKRIASESSTSKGRAECLMNSDEIDLLLNQLDIENLIDKVDLFCIRSLFKVE